MFTPQPVSEFETVALPQMKDLYRTARRVLGSQTDAEDIVQETYLQAWRSFHHFEPGTNIRAWLFRIMFHVIQHHRRKAWRLVTLKEEEEFLFESLAWTPPVPPELRDEDLLAALDQLPPHFRAVIMLADVQEFSYRETAETLNIPIGTVMSRLSRGRQMLRTRLADLAPASKQATQFALAQSC